MQMLISSAAATADAELRNLNLLQSLGSNAVPPTVNLELHELELEGYLSFRCSASRHAVAFAVAGAPAAAEMRM